MARISAYPQDREINDNDNWIGSSSPGQMTRNFSAKSVAEYIITDYSFGLNMKFLFLVDTQGAGTITDIADGAGFDTISSIRISTQDASKQYVVDYLNYLVGSNILISQDQEVSNFAEYKVVSYAQVGTTAFYTLQLTYIGGNGSIVATKYYNVNNFAKASDTDKTFVFDQPTPATVWTIPHLLNKFPSVTIVNDANEIVYAQTLYQSVDQVRINFAIALQGKAYLN
jgi:hypothetical protein|tara:strand:+ start:957 stop:1637 length:681 start_codon:yes stop_codon:yes gene_type:complete